MNIVPVKSVGVSPTPRYAHGSAVVDHRWMYVFGGFESHDLKRGVSCTLHCFDMVVNEWTELLPMITEEEYEKRMAFAANKRMGTTNELLVPHSELIAQNRWPSARMRHTLVADGQYLILFGGIDAEQTALNDTWVYDIETGFWTVVAASSATKHLWRIAKYPSPRFGHCCVALYRPEWQEVSMLLFGGSNKEGQPQDDLWVFRRSTRQWWRVIGSNNGQVQSTASLLDVSKKASPTVAPSDAMSEAAFSSEASPLRRIFGVACAVSNNVAYVFGGCKTADSNASLRDLWRLDLSTQSMNGPSAQGHTSRVVKSLQKDKDRDRDKDKIMAFCGDTMFLIQWTPEATAPSDPMPANASAKSQRDSKIPLELSSSAFAYFPPNLYLAGGADDMGRARGESYLFHLFSRSWSRMPPMENCPAVEGASFAVGLGYLLLFGGRDRNAHHNGMFNFTYPMVRAGGSYLLAACLGTLPQMRKLNLQTPAEEILQREDNKVVLQYLSNVLGRKLTLKTIRDVVFHTNAMLILKYGPAPKRHFTVTVRKKSTVDILDDASAASGSKLTVDSLLEDSQFKKKDVYRRVRKVVRRKKKDKSSKSLQVDEVLKKATTGSQGAGRSHDKKSLSLPGSDDEEDEEVVEARKRREYLRKAYYDAAEHENEPDPDEDDYEYEEIEIVEEEDMDDLDARFDTNRQMFRASTVFQAGEYAPHQPSSRQAKQIDPERAKAIQAIRDHARSLSKRSASSVNETEADRVLREIQQRESPRVFVQRRLEQERVCSLRASNGVNALMHPKPPKNFSIAVRDEVFDRVQPKRRDELKVQYDTTEKVFAERVHGSAVFLFAAPQYNVGAPIPAPPSVPSSSPARNRSVHGRTVSAAAVLQSPRTREANAEFTVNNTSSSTPRVRDVFSNASFGAARNDGTVPAVTATRTFVRGRPESINVPSPRVSFGLAGATHVTSPVLTPSLSHVAPAPPVVPRLDFRAVVRHELTTHREKLSQWGISTKSSRATPRSARSLGSTRREIS